MRCSVTARSATVDGTHCAAHQGDNANCYLRCNTEFFEGACPVAAADTSAFTTLLLQQSTEPFGNALPSKYVW